MENLKENWLTEGLVDFEYKKYILLAYLQNVKNKFSERKLYPVLNDLIFHYKNLMRLKENKQLIYDKFPQRISKADFIKLKISYEKIVQDDEVMQELEEIIQYSIPRVKGMLEDGKEIYELIEQNLELFPVGISPLYTDEGYLFIEACSLDDTLVYRYQVTVFENADETFRGISTSYLESAKRHLGVTYESLKRQLLKKYEQLPNPATFTVISKISCPFEESLMPVAKRMLMKHIAQMAA